MKKLWLLYADEDFQQNRDFAELMRRTGEACGLWVEPVLLSELWLGTNENGAPFCLRNGKPECPTAVLSRQRNAWVSRHFEKLGIPVFNNARVCELCNDKRSTHQFLTGIPMPETFFVPDKMACPPSGIQYPLIVKPACSHGGDRVTLAADASQWQAATARIFPQPALAQRVVSGAGRDLRVYVLFGQIIAGVMRTAKEGVVSNFKLGGSVSLHTLTTAERELALRVIRCFEEASAPLCLAGVDLLYEGERPVLGEVEDVVGSRMLYQVSQLDIVALYLDEIRKQLP
ncbi:MAG: ATP-grasp domain-containing protein [Clostridia bacterium]